MFGVFSRVFDVSFIFGSRVPVPGELFMDHMMLVVLLKSAWIPTNRLFVKGSPSRVPLDISELLSLERSMPWAKWNRENPKRL